jgi:diguanylate cyclase (GGDEF)-like protein
LGQKEQTMRDLAHHDPLTGLANRLLLSTHLEQCIKRARRNSLPFALLMIDLDGFKPVNDLHGHDAGDLLLCAIAKRLAAHVRESDLVARVGGDEFVCVLESVGESDAAVAVANKLIREVRGPVRLEGGEEVTVGASIGIAMFDESISASDQLLRFADDAMYAAKAAGKNCARFSADAKSVSNVD